MTLAVAVPLAKQAVTAKQAAAALGLDPDRHGRCACPLHGGKDRNMKLYDGDRGFYCYVCHAGGDVIDLVRGVTNTDLKGAVAWLDGTFRLGLDVGRPEDRKRTEAARKAVETKREQRRREEAERAAVFDAQLDALSLNMRIDEMIEANRPRRYGDGFSDAFCAALEARETMRRVTEELDIMASEVNA